MDTTKKRVARAIVPGAALILMATLAFVPWASANEIYPDLGNCGIGFNCGCADNGHGGCTGYRCIIYPINVLLFSWCDLP